MNIEITGANFSNKGAQLMLATVCHRLRSAIPEICLSVPAGCAKPEERSEFGLSVTIRPPRGRKLRIPRNRDKRRELVKALMTEMTAQWTPSGSFGLVHENRLDGILDISGYAFGDKWPATKGLRLSVPAADLQRREKPVIMLPQMLGPFTKPGQAEAFQDLSSHVDLIYARERQSYDFARPHVTADRLRLAPDITIAMPAKTGRVIPAPYACIVPNSKLLEPNPQRQDWKASYLDRLATAYFHCRKRGLDTFLVQHELNEGDTNLVAALRQQIGCPEDHIVTHSDPRVLKGILGGAELVIGSRFHSLVSALSMGVPSIALGWAHKYDALLQDFGVSELIHYATSAPGHILELIDTTLENHADFSQRIQARKSELVREVDDMWIEVFGQLQISPVMNGISQKNSGRNRSAA